MPERESIQVERELANGVFAWLQTTGDELPPPLNTQAQDLLEQLHVAHADLLELRAIINDLDDRYHLPIRIYVSGFEEEVVRQLDGNNVFDDARQVFFEQLAGLFLVDPVEEERLFQGYPAPSQILSEVEIIVHKSEKPEGLKAQKSRNKTLGAYASRVVAEWPKTPSLSIDTLSLLITDAEGDEEAVRWQEKALCAQTDPEAFFPEKGGSTREAKKVCAACEVREECLDAALENDERFGIWGGLSERERRKLKKRAV